ncbi:hypothetical protein ABEY41_19175 [Peribacillus butanolivorans]|uniref:hypothetical protein n=1 Tax=Peribacillus butanolivorans TaxID=421767 RepID=UPI003D27F626
MEFTLLENGTDSLKKAKVSIEKFEDSHHEHSYHHLKDAIIYLNHGIEILLKYILSSRNESLIFSDIKVYLDAKKQLKHMPSKVKGFGTYLEKNMPTVFDVPEDKLKNKNLRTITLHEAVERIEYLCDIYISNEFKSSIFLINKYRNDITHHSINLNPVEEEEMQLIKILKALYGNVLDFFEQHIPGIMENIDTKRFEVTKEEYEEMQRDMQEFYHERALSHIALDEDEY